MACQVDRLKLTTLTHQAHRDGGDRASAERFFAQSIKVAQLSAAGRGTVLKHSPPLPQKATNFSSFHKHDFLHALIKVAQLSAGGRGPVLTNSPLPTKLFFTSIFPYISFQRNHFSQAFSLFWRRAVDQGGLTLSWRPGPGTQTTHPPLLLRKPPIQSRRYR